MSGCDCANCPKHCGDEDEIEKNTDEKVSEDSCDDDSSEDEAKTTASKKIEKLKQAIIALGFSIETTEQGLRISR